MTSTCGCGWTTQEHRTRLGLRLAKLGHDLVHEALHVGRA